LCSHLVFYIGNWVLNQTDAGRLSAIAVESSLADISIKRKWFSTFMQQENPLSLSHQRVAMVSMFPPNQPDLQEALLPSMLDTLVEINKSRDNYYQRSYARELFAGVCSTAGLLQMKKALDKD